MVSGKSINFLIVILHFFRLPLFMHQKRCRRDVQGAMGSVEVDDGVVGKVGQFCFLGYVLDIEAL